MPSVDPLSLQILFQSFEGLKAQLKAYGEGKAGVTSVDTLLLEIEPLAQLAQAFRLSRFEQMIVLLTAALELEPNFQALCAQVQGDAQKPYPTLGLALSALPEADWSVLSPQNALHYWHLIQTEPSRLLTQSPIQLDRRILCYLLGEPALSVELADVVTPSWSADVKPTLSPSYQAIVQQLMTAWSTALPYQPLPLIALMGGDAPTKVAIAVAACDRMGLQLMTLSSTVLPTNPQDLIQLQRHWEREAILTRSALLLDCEVMHSADPGRETAIALFLETLSTPTILISRDRTPQLRRALITLEMPPLPHDETVGLWQTHLGTAATELQGYIDLLATQFKLTPNDIQAVCGQFNIQTAVWEEHGSALFTNGPLFTPEQDSTAQLPSKIDRTDSRLNIHNALWMLCRRQARANLDDLAQRIEARATWEELVLPDRQRQILEDIAAHLSYRARVYQEWGFAQKGDRGLGISALFYGESGTGKTMAAEVLAQTCCLDLYRIDLSTVVSKYIGETEKNLRRIFDAAETGGVILLFDEADALFGRRTEVKDSHDRHANIEVSYLLQRMEAYQGLAILTSNLKDSLDKAFLRRLRFMVPFPFPDAEARADIWRGIFPTQTPIQDLDYAKLGQLKVAGGNIRNIALNAAFLAAQADQPVDMSHIRQAAQREYLKLEKLLTTEETKGWE